MPCMMVSSTNAMSRMPKVTKEKVSKPREVATHARSKAKAWTLTINEPTEADRPRDEGRFLAYGIFGMEKAPTTGMPHIQGYVVYPKRVYFNVVKADFPRAHIEVARGTPDHNYAYCSKEGDFYEVGERPEARTVAGHKASLENYESAYELAKAGDLEAIPKNMLTRYYRTYKQIRDDNLPMPADLDRTTGLWISGPSGVGKSRLARCYVPFYHKRPNKWWDGYAGEPYVIMEDLDPTHRFLAHDLKIYCDRYAFPAEIKGGRVTARPQLVIITSQYTIEQVFAGDPETIEALNRRMKKIVIPVGPLPDMLRAQAEAEVKRTQEGV